MFVWARVWLLKASCSLLNFKRFEVPLPSRRLLWLPSFSAVRSQQESLLKPTLSTGPKQDDPRSYLWGVCGFYDYSFCSLGVPHLLPAVNKERERAREFNYFFSMKSFSFRFRAFGAFVCCCALLCQYVCCSDIQIF